MNNEENTQEYVLRFVYGTDLQTAKLMLKVATNMPDALDNLASNSGYPLIGVDMSNGICTGDSINNVPIPQILIDDAISRHPDAVNVYQKLIDRFGKDNVDKIIVHDRDTIANNMKKTIMFASDNVYHADTITIIFNDYMLGSKVYHRFMDLLEKHFVVMHVIGDNHKVVIRRKDSAVVPVTEDEPIKQDSEYSEKVKDHTRSLSIGIEIARLNAARLYELKFFESSNMALKDSCLTVHNWDTSETRAVEYNSMLIGVISNMRDRIEIIRKLMSSEEIDGEVQCEALSTIHAAERFIEIYESNCRYINESWPKISPMQLK